MIDPVTGQIIARAGMERGLARLRQLAQAADVEWLEQFYLEEACRREMLLAEIDE